MTNGEKMVKDLISAKFEMARVLEKVEDAEGGLLGMEVKYKGKEAMVANVDGNRMRATLFVGYDDEEVSVSLNELLEIVS